MPLLGRDEIKEIVEDCLRRIGDFSGDIESLMLTGIHDHSLDRFVDCIGRKLTNKRITVRLSVSFVKEMTEDGKTLGDLINHFLDDQSYG